MARDAAKKRNDFLVTATRGIRSLRLSCDELADAADNYSDITERVCQAAADVELRWVESERATRSLVDLCSVYEMSLAALGESQETEE